MDGRHPDQSETGRDRTVRDRPIIFGEVLFDCFGDGERVLGGAPFNVAWHLSGFGLDPLLISAVGDDPDGAKVLEAMRSWGLSTRGVAVDPLHPTGLVDVRVVEGQPTFSILTDRAWDFIPTTAVEAAAPRGGGLLYHGTLASRSPVSAASLQRLRTMHLPTFVDVNLRPPWWNRASVFQLLSGSRWIKLNSEELAAMLGPESAEGDAESLRHRLDLEAVIVTRGEKGASVRTAQGQRSAAPPRLTAVTDTVGAGDALSAVTIFGLLRNWPWSVTLERAVAFAGEVCRIQGAVARDRTFYKRALSQWEIS